MSPILIRRLEVQDLSEAEGRARSLRRNRNRNRRHSILRRNIRHSIQEGARIRLRRIRIRIRRKGIRPQH